MSAGLALVALMYVFNLFIGLNPLPQLLQQPILAVMPGPVFGFFIDTLQHAGKVVEEASLILAMVVSLGVLGAVRRPRDLPGPDRRSRTALTSIGGSFAKYWHAAGS